MYSQNKEEAYILQHFTDKSDGRFLDIGAYDGMTFSNTYALVGRGWSGLEVEASPINFVNLMKNVRKDNVKLLCAAICQEAGSITLHDSQGDAISTTDDKHKAKWTTRAGGVDWQPVEVLSMTPNNLLNAYGHDYNMIDIDVEGYSYELFKLFNWELLMECSLIVVEHDNKVDEIEQRLENLGYHTVFLNGENIILTRDLK